MAFGQVAGPPASQRTVDEIAALLEARGYDSFKEARHPFGLTQRQAAGRFAVAEAEELLARLQADAEAGIDGPPDPDDEPAPRARSERAAQAKAIVARAERRRAPDRAAAQPRPAPSRRTSAGRASSAPSASGGADGRERARQEEAVVGFEAEVLATELTNRGWCVIPPPE